MRRFLASVLLAALAGGAASAATPSPRPKPSPPARIDLTKIQNKALLPKKKLHTEFVVEVNRMGQVSRVRSGKNSSDHAYNFQTYGNALQAFIRTPEGNAVSGIYRLTYDYDPKTARIRRDVQFIRAGGTNPNAQGAANQLEAIAARHRNDTPPPRPAGTAPPVDAKSLPDLNGVIHASPAPK